MSDVQRPGTAFASTPVELLAALIRGWRHIVITAHVDLTTLELRETAICPDGCASPLIDIRGTESIRGNCSDDDGGAELEALTAALDGAAMLPLQGGQCLVLTYEDSLPFVIEHMWLDNVYLRMKYVPEAPHPRQNQYATLAGQAPLVGPQRWHGQHYITRSTFQGDGLGPAVGVWADENVYVENCTFANLGGDAFAEGCVDCSAAIAAANVSVTVVNSTFLDPAPFSGTAYIRAWADSRVVVSGCTFAPTPLLPDVPFYVADSSMIFTDTPGVRMRCEDDGLEVGAQPLSAVPAAPADPTEAILQRTDPWFVNITSALNEDLPPQAAFPAAAASSQLLQPLGSKPQAVLPPAAAPAGDSAKDGPSAAAIIGGTVGAALLLAVVAAACLPWRRSRRRRKRQSSSKRTSRRPGSEVLDMVTTGSHSETGSVPNSKLVRAQSSWRPGSARVQGSSACHGPEAVSAAGPPAAPLVPNGRPLLAADAALPDVLAIIQAQLHSIGPYVTLQEQFRLIGSSHIRTGGQSVVAYAEGAFSPEPYVMKFFPIRESFDAELALRDSAALAPLLPVIRSAYDPELPDEQNQPIVDRWGQSLPPCIVFPRGEGLVDWLRRAMPDIFVAASVVAHIASSLRDIHAAGFVHCAVKPAHIVQLRKQNRWALVDFDRAAAVGAAVPLRHDLPYAPPEAVAAGAEGRAAVAADPALDAWALGVVAFELLTGHDLFEAPSDTEEQWREQLLGHAPLPWEGERLTDDNRSRLGIFQAPLLGLLRRDPAKRTSMEDFCSACHDVVASHTTTAAV